MKLSQSRVYTINHDAYLCHEMQTRVIYKTFKVLSVVCPLFILLTIEAVREIRLCEIKPCGIES